MWKTYVWDSWNIHFVAHFWTFKWKNVQKLLCSLKHQYKSFESDKASATFSYPIIFLVVPHLFGFVIAKSFNSFKKETPHVPKFDLLKISVTVMISGLTFNAAILYLEFPIVVLIKSCNILSVILVGVFCSRVKPNTNQRLGK